MAAMNKTDQMSFFGFEPAPAVATVKSVKAKTAKTAVPKVKVSDWTLSELTHPITTVASQSPAAQALPNTWIAQGAPEPTSDVEAMAGVLSQHPDFRVLRRLQPRTDYGPLNAQSTQRVIVLDTETTGLDARQEKVIELAMLSVLVDTTTGQPVGPVTLYESFEDPGKPIPPQITEITGIDDSMVQGQRIDDAAVTALVEQADLIVAHNAGFDRPFVELLICRHRLEERRQRLGQAGIFGFRARLVLRRAPRPSRLSRALASFVIALVRWPNRFVTFAERGRADPLQTAGHRRTV
jgi:DNA polymerase-3 subunit epsilon